MSFKTGNAPWNKVSFDDDKLRTLYIKEQMTASQIAQYLGIGSAPVYRRLRELGIIRTNSESHIGKRPGNYKGRYVEGRSGYIMVHLSEDHPYACMGIYTRHEGTYVREHRLVMAKHLGRPLSSAEVVHHKNGQKGDNRIENLELFPSQAGHNALTVAHERIKDLEAELETCRAALLAMMDKPDAKERRKKR